MPLRRRSQRGQRVSLKWEIEKGFVFVPVAIPSKSREDQLCKQTLTMLRHYGYDMEMVHVFVDALFTREDGSNEYDRYCKHLQQEGFGEVGIHPGGQGLRKQYEKIFEFFENRDRIILTSDTVPRIMWRRLVQSVAMEELPQEYLGPIIEIGFDLCHETGARAWSLAPGKNGVNMLPGRISKKCGLLCGNFCGVRMDLGRPIQMTVSDYTTDVEFSLKTWQRDGAMIRFLGITAEHVYRARGGHASPNSSEDKRYKATAKAISSLVKEFPTLIRYNEHNKRPKTVMPYRFAQVGPPPMVLDGSYEARGRRPDNGMRAMSKKMRTRRCRSAKKKINKA